MGLAIYWSQFAITKLEEIYSYCRFKAGTTIAQNIVNGILDCTIDLDKNPEIGQVEIALEDEYREFRYLIYTNYKIIYFINRRTDRIVIANVFDTRQNPDKITVID